MAISTSSGGAQKTQAAPDRPLDGPPRRTARFRIPFRKPISPRELIYFLSHISLMLEVGTSLTTALEAMEVQTRNSAFRDVLAGMLRDIREGRQLSDAMGRHPEVFDRVLTSMIRAGEAGGFLKETLARLVQMEEKRQALITQLRTALTYPVVLCVVAFLVVIFVMVGVLPKFGAIFEGKESILPLTTRYLLAASASLRAHWWAYLLGAAGAVAALIAWKRSPQGQAVIDRLAVSMPPFAALTNKIYTCHLLRTLGHLLESHVPLLDALTSTRATLGNRHYRDLIDQVTLRVQQGGRLSHAFNDHPYIIESVRQMIATGEEVGNLYPVMLRLADFYDSEVEQELKTVSSLIEPLALIVLGTIIGIIVASVILPMFKIAHALA